ncbi:MAG: Unknown protein [uncultured Sulfurovum sp.]|uniref:Uncharacterized protein n=1 Tax=uncultured Sulfurovum sp. TaxID=269237 RepID=A0A6S6S4H5_9BACT|nr:MAG: Unknown protein [uncultured Sulfurovum sp.]
MPQYEQLKDAIAASKTLSSEEKTQSVQHIEEWITEDRAFGLIYDELIEVSEAFKEIFRELGLV